MPYDNAITNLRLAWALSDKVGDKIPNDGHWHQVIFDCYRRDDNFIYINKINITDTLERIKTVESEANDAT